MGLAKGDRKTSKCELFSEYILFRGCFVDSAICEGKEETTSTCKVIKSYPLGFKANIINPFICPRHIELSL